MKCTFIILIIFSALITWAQSEEPQQNLIIDSIICQGNNQTSCELIIKEFYQNPGDILNEEEVQNAKIRLRLKNLFESVNVFLKKGEQKYHIAVTFDVVEKDPTFTETTINSGLDYPFKSSDLKFTFGNRNLFGDGESLTGTVGYLSLGDSESKLATGKIEYTDPHLLDSKSYFFNTSIEQIKSLKQREILANEAFTSYAETITTYTLGGGKRIFDFSYISLRFSHTDALYRNVPNSLETYSSIETTNSIDLSYGWNTENDIYFATTGDRFNVNYNKTLYNQNFLSNTEGNSQESYQATYSRRFLITKENSIRLAGTGYTSVYRDLDSDSKLNFVNPTIEVNHQLIDTPSNKNNFIQKAKLYFNLSPIYTFASDNAVSYSQQELGVLMDSKKLGVIKLFLTHWSLQ